MDPRTKAMADVLVNYSVAVQPGDWVMIQSSPLAEPLIDALTAAVLRAGGQPSSMMNSEAVAETFYREASTEQASFISPLEEAILFNYPAYLQGHEVTGVRLVFEGGKAVEATAETGEEFLLEMLNMDEGARRLGEIAFGTNHGIKEPTKNTLFDEKIAGTLHMALGRAFPEAGGTNVSALHCDMVYNLRDGATVTVDGQVFSRDGRFEN